MNESYEFQGKTVDDAIAAGLIELGLHREQVDIEVVHKGSRGIFGIGSEPARVRLTTTKPTNAPPLPPPDVEDGARQSADHATDVDAALDSAPSATPDDVVSSETVSDDAAPDVVAANDSAAPNEAGSQLAGHESSTDDLPDDDLSSDAPQDDAPNNEVAADQMSDEELAQFAGDLLDEMVELMGYEAEVLAAWQEPEPGESDKCLLLEVNGDGLGALIGRRGETLSNIQFLLRLMINQKTHSWYNIVVDVAGYKERRAEQLTQLAMRIAQQVAESQRSASLEPMPSNERRVIHMALRNHPDVFTQSSGEGDRRKVHIAPKI